MASTSSIHKPGWRSRRRSRLSLVERAVPRLGQMPRPDDAPKTVIADDDTANTLTAFETTSEARPEISEAVAEKRSETLMLTGPADGGPADSGDGEQAQTSNSENGDQSLFSTSLPAEPLDDDSPAAQIHPPSDTVEPESEPAQSTTGLIRSPEQADIDTQSPPKADIADLATDPETPIAPALPSLESPSDVAKVTNAAEPTDDARRLDLADDHPHELPVPLEDTPKAETSVGLFIPKSDTDAPTAPRGPTLELEWDSLVESGFIDPRHRDQPLPQNMDPIIRALLRQALSDQSSWRDRIILVTSPNERTSKSTAAINFAFGLTTVGDHRAVLVDTDSTGRGAVDRLGGRDRMGITDALAGDDLALDDLVIRTDLDRLTLVASGTPDEDLVDHLASRRMLQILRHLTEAPETILVIDAPPILVSQEAAVLSVVAGQVVLAVEAGRTTGDQIEHALQRIGDRHNVSLVLNESSGLQRKHSRSRQRRSDSAKAKRRAPETKRHLAKAAAAAAVALALGLIIQQFQAEAAPSDVVDISKRNASADVVFEPERWPHQPEMMMGLCRQMCR